MWFSRLTPALFLALGGLLGVVGPAPALTTQRVASGLRYPIFATAPSGDERLFIVDQRGVIRILENGTVLATPFLDIDPLIPNISGNDERGLLGLAFHPDYASNGYFFLNYINLSSDTVIARYTVSADPNVADPGSAQILLTIDQPANNHNGGTLLFGPLDGYLYIGMGDGGGAGDPNGNGQNDGTLLGKMLRIDVDNGLPYTIPPDNPFVGPGLPLDEIWSKGWRNPYRWSFDRLTGDVWIADVGQSAWEEIDFEPPLTGGRNYGWRLMEGNHCYNPPINCDDGSLIHPIYEYSHGGGRCSITGGSIYRGSIPEIRGAYFFADFCTSQIWSIRYDGQNVFDFKEWTTELAPGGGMSISSIAGICEDAFGELYICDRGTGSNGEIYKILLNPNEAQETGTVSGFGLSAARPDPFSDETRVILHTDRPGLVSVIVADATGRVIRTLHEGFVSDPVRELTWDGRDQSGRPAAQGVYFIRASIPGNRVNRQALLIR